MDDTLLRRSPLGARQRAGLAVHAALVLGLVPALVLLAPPSRWDQPLLLGVLSVLGVIAIRSEVRLPSGVSFEALSALSLIAVALAGPLPALAVTLAPIAVNALSGRERLLRAGNLANLAAYGWYALLAGLLLQLAAPADLWGWLLLAGILQLLVNWALGPAVYVTCWLGHPARTAWEMLRDGLATGAVMVALGTLTVLLAPALGLLALVVFAVIAVLPQTGLTYVARTRPVARLDRSTATRRYAQALCVQLDLPRAERRRVLAVAAAACRRAPSDDARGYIAATFGGTDAAGYDAELVAEHWDGSGGALGLRGTSIPLTARIVAVADAWSAGTARHTRQLSHEDALSELRRDAGRCLDPAIVAAAHRVVAQEPVNAADPAPEPRLHRLPLPSGLRRTVAGLATTR